MSTSRTKSTVAAFVCALLAACAATSADDDAVAAFLERAEIYYRGKDFRRAEAQVMKGLRVEPKHYRLNQLRGRLLLKRAQSDPAMFELARKQYEAVVDLRSFGSHDYRTWLGLAQAHQGLYQNLRTRAATLERQASAPMLAQSERKELAGRRDESYRLFRNHLAAAEKNYGNILEQGDGTFAALYGLFLVATDLAAELEGPARDKQIELAIERGRSYLEESKRRIEHYEKLVARTDDAWIENETRRHYRELKRREAEFRSTLANLHYDRKEFDEALAQLDAILEQDPTRAVEYFNRARCHVSLGHKDSAKRDLEDFLRLTRLPFESPKVREAHELLAKFGG